jgi:hypothetical protein
MPVPIREWSDEECSISCNRQVSAVATGMLGLGKIHEDSCLKAGANYEPVHRYLFHIVLMILLATARPVRRAVMVLINWLFEKHTMQSEARASATVN